MSEIVDLLPEYLSHKRVRAAKILSTRQLGDGYSVQVALVAGDAQIPVDDDWWTNRYKPTSGEWGYLVRYEDGYLSWSPSKAFEEGYDLVGEAQAAAEPKNHDGLALENLRAQTRLTNAQAAEMEDGLANRQAQRAAPLLETVPVKKADYALLLKIAATVEREHIGQLSREIEVFPGDGGPITPSMDAADAAFGLLKELV